MESALLPAVDHLELLHTDSRQAEGLVVQHWRMLVRLQGTVRVASIGVHLPLLPAARSACTASDPQHMYAAAWLLLMHSMLA